MCKIFMYCMNFISSHDRIKYADKVRALVSGLDADPTMEKLSAEQLQDLNEILNLAGFLLAKYEDQKNFHDILKEFVDIIRHTASSIENIDGSIEDLLISAEGSVASLREAYERMSRSDK